MMCTSSEGLGSQAAARAAELPLAETVCEVVNAAATALNLTLVSDRRLSMNDAWQIGKAQPHA